MFYHLADFLFCAFVGAVQCLSLRSIYCVLHKIRSHPKSLCTQQFPVGKMDFNFQHLVRSCQIHIIIRKVLKCSVKTSSRFSTRHVVYEKSSLPLEAFSSNRMNTYTIYYFNLLLKLINFIHIFVKQTTTTTKKLEHKCLLKTLVKTSNGGEDFLESMSETNS